MVASCWSNPPSSLRRQASARRGSTWLLWLCALVALAGLAVAAVWWLQSGDQSESTKVLLHTVQRGVFRHEIIERGEVESSSNVEVRCEVKSRNSGGTTILEVVDEGTIVQPGDVIVRLDASALEQELVQQQIVYNTSKALVVQAENALEAAKIGKTEYLEGTYQQEKQAIESEIFVAKENQRRAEEYARFSERLAAKGYVTAAQLEGDRFAVEKTRNELATAETKLRVLQEYTKRKMLIELESEINTAEAKLNAEQSSHQLESDKLKDIEDQIAKCTVRAPSPGQVVYANVVHHGQAEFVVEAGAMVRQNQTIVRLPDPQQMQVKTNVPESRITNVRPGMNAEVRIDAFGDGVLTGEVVRVNEYPEAQRFGSSAVKQYATFVKINDPPKNLRPGLAAEVRIDIETVPDVLQAPVQTILEHGGKLYCAVADGDAWQRREVQLGAASDSFVVVTSGLDAGEHVALDPLSLRDVLDLPKISEEEAEKAALARKPKPAEQTPPAGSQRPSPATIVKGVFEKYDANKDGVLGADEIPADQAARLASADTDGDGNITRAELTAQIAKFFSQGGGGPPRGSGPPSGSRQP